MIEIVLEICNDKNVLESLELIITINISNPIHLFFLRNASIWMWYSLLYQLIYLYQ